MHFLVTLVLSAGAAALVFLVWFPDPFQTMLGGTKLFLVLVLCDLGLGPLTSFIIYNSKKSRRALLFDYTVVGTIQLAAFIYGVHAVANTRPVYIAFVGDRIEVVTGWRARRCRPRAGLRILIASDRNGDRSSSAIRASAGSGGAQQDAVFRAGRQRLLRAAGAITFRTSRDLPQIKRRALPVSELEQRHPEAKPLLASAVAQLQVSGRRARLVAGQASRAGSGLCCWTRTQDTL